MSSIILVIAAIIGLKFAINLYNLYRTKSLFKTYKDYVDDPTWDFSKHHHEIMRLFEGAGTSDSQVTVVENLGFGNLQKAQASVFDNMTVTRGDVIGLVRKMFHRTIGTYRSRMLDAVNPFFWVQFVLNLPREALSFLGISPESTLSRVFQLIYWLIGALITLALALYPDEIRQLLEGILSSIPLVNSSS